MWDLSPPVPSSGTSELITAEVGLGSPSTQLSGQLTQENGTCLWKSKKIKALTSTCAFGMKSKTHFSWMGRENKCSQQQLNPKKSMEVFLFIFLWADCIQEMNNCFENWMDVCCFFRFCSSDTIVANTFNSLCSVRMKQRGASFRKSKQHVGSHLYSLYHSLKATRVLYK